MYKKYFYKRPNIDKRVPIPFDQFYSDMIMLNEHHTINLSNPHQKYQKYLDDIETQNSADFIIESFISNYENFEAEYKNILEKYPEAESVNELMQSLIDAKESGIIKDYEIKDGQVYIIHQPAIQEINVKCIWK